MSILGSIAEKGYDVVTRPVAGSIAGGIALGETLIGVGATALSVLHRGNNEDINAWARMTFSAEKILQGPLHGVLWGLNSKTASLDELPDPILTSKLPAPILKFATDAASKQKYWTFRAALVAGNLAVVATRIADFAIGVIATAIALCCFGQWTWMNNHAISQIGVTGIIPVVAYSLISFVNPRLP